MQRPYLAYRDESLALEEGNAGADVALVGRAGERRERLSVRQSSRKSASSRRICVLFSRPEGAAPKLVAILRWQAATVFPAGRDATTAALDEAMYSPGRLSVATGAQATHVGSSAGSFGAVGRARRTTH